MYPAFIMVIVVGVVAVMMILVVPRLLDIFMTDDGSTDGLPGSTQLLVKISDMFRDYWLVMLIVIFITVVLIKIWKRTPNGRYVYDNVMLYVPVF
jgi:type II secretory pathway component PulF